MVDTQYHQLDSYMIYIYILIRWSPNVCMCAGRIVRRHILTITVLLHYQIELYFVEHQFCVEPLNLFTEFAQKIILVIRVRIYTIDAIDLADRNDAHRIRILRKSVAIKCICRLYITREIMMN